MKTKLTIILLFILCSIAGFTQQYGWVNIGGKLPSSSGTTTLTDLYFVSADEGWICSGALGEIYHTTNGGFTYTTQTTQYYTNAIRMLSSSEGYAGGINGRVYRTTNGGSTWSVLGSIGGTLLSINFPPSSTTGYCSGFTGKIYSITTTGVSSMPTGLSSNLSSINFPTTSQGWACGGTIIVHYNGSSWTTDQAYPSESYNAIHMVTNTIGWAVGDNGVIIKTTDGTNWNYQANPDKSNRSLYDVFFLDANNGWAVGYNGVILHTTNEGALWTIEASGVTINSLNAIQFISTTIGYIIGDHGTLLKYTQLTGIENVDESNKSSKLMQNEPNPFRSTTSLKYALHQPGHVKLAVYNLQGEMICFQVNEYQSAGEHTVMFDGNGLPSGVYYYRLQTETGTSARKMTLIK